jgi:hypothetical protein
VCKSRTNLQHHKQPFAHDVEFCPDLLSAIRALKPTALIGVSTMPKAFRCAVLCCSVLCCVVLCCAVLCCAVSLRPQTHTHTNRDVPRKIPRSATPACHAAAGALLNDNQP